MENSSYALQFVAAILISAMVIALVVFVFNNLRTYENAQDEAVSRESVTEFNDAFKVYDKNLMYGTDVLSCLNKAQNNNQQYVYDSYSDSADFTINQEYLIQVNVKLNSTLQEEVTAYYKSTSGVISIATTGELQSRGVSDEGSYSFTPFSSASGFSLPTVTYYYFSSTSSKNMTKVSSANNYSSIMWPSGKIDGTALNSWNLKTTTFNTAMSDTTNYYKLYGETDGDATRTAQLMALVSTTTFSNEQTIYNSASGTGIATWYSATWQTAAYDFKTRKFKCTDVSYNDDTGYINSLTFEEVTNY